MYVRITVLSNQLSYAYVRYKVMLDKFFFMYCCRYWEALTKWNEALQLAPSAKLYEMKSQVNNDWFCIFEAFELLLDRSD